MSLQNARIACTALTKRIMLGNVEKDGLSFSGTKRDVTSDCLKAVIDFVGVDYESEVVVNGIPTYKITVQKVVTL